MCCIATWVIAAIAARGPSKQTGTSRFRLMAGTTEKLLNLNVHPAATRALATLRALSWPANHYPKGCATVAKAALFVRR